MNWWIRIFVLLIWRHDDLPYLNNIELTESTNSIIIEELYWICRSVFGKLQESAPFFRFILAIYHLQRIKITKEVKDIIPSDEYKYKEGFYS